MLSTAGRAMLLSKQQELMEQRRQWEDDQTDLSYDIDFYHVAQHFMQILDDEAEILRRVLDGGECVA